MEALVEVSQMMHGGQGISGRKRGTDRGPERRANKVEKLRPESLELGPPAHLVLIKRPPPHSWVFSEIVQGTVVLCNVLSQEIYVRLT